MIVYRQVPHYFETRLVKLGPDDFGLYASGLRNSFGTPLMARGTLDEMLDFRKLCSMTKMERVEARRGS